MEKSEFLKEISILDREQIRELLEHPFINKCNFTKGQTKKAEDEIVMIQAAMLISNFDYKNFSFKEVNRFLQENDDLSNYFTTIRLNMDILDKII